MKKTSIQICNKIDKQDGIIIPYFSDKKINLGPNYSEIEKQIQQLQNSGEFNKKGNTLHLLFGVKKLSKIILISFGNHNEFNSEIARIAMGIASKEAKRMGAKHLVLDLCLMTDLSDREGALFAISEALFLAVYSYEHLKNPRKKIEAFSFAKLDIMGISHKELSIIVEAYTVSRYTNFARELSFTPANLMTPSILAKRAKEEAEKVNCAIQILNKKEILKEEMTSFLSVANGSDEECKFIIMEHKAKKPKNKEKIVLIGKGVTFDTGGISLKPRENMHTMKADMSGAAAVIATLLLVSDLELPIDVIGLIPATENMPNGRATKPGDLIYSKKGLSIEVLNTDAEGRLILNDALTYAERYQADYVIDIATLTGAMVTSLGDVATGMMGNNQTLMDDLTKAGNICYERVWQFPLFDEYKKQLESPAADLANIGGPKAGSITAAMFLSYFADQFKWAHLDIAGTSESNGEKSYLAKGSSGVGVRLFYNYLKTKVRK